MPRPGPSQTSLDQAGRILQLQLEVEFLFINKIEAPNILVSGFRFPFTR